MSTLNTTIYPKLKKGISEYELFENYTPEPSEIEFVNTNARNSNTRLHLMILLKVFQNIKYYPTFETIPNDIIKYISNCLNIKTKTKFSRSSREKFKILIRNHLDVKQFNKKEDKNVIKFIKKESFAKDDLTDLINILIEYLINNNYELPGFTSIVKICKKIKVETYNDIFLITSNNLTEEEKSNIDKLFVKDDNNDTLWKIIKRETKKPTISNLKEILVRLEFIKNIHKFNEFISRFNNNKLSNFSLEAASLNAGEMKKVKPEKRYTLAVSLLNNKYSSTLDDIAEMFIKIMNNIHSAGKVKLKEYILDRTKITDSIVKNFKTVIETLNTESKAEDKIFQIERMLKNKKEYYLEQCDVHLSFAGNNYNGFLWEIFKYKRATIFNIINSVPLKSSTNDKNLLKIIEFVKTIKNKRKDWINLDVDYDFNLDWIPYTWWKLVTGYSSKDKIPYRIHRKHFEVCLFSEVMLSLKSGDLYIENSDEYSDFRKQQITWEEYDKLLQDYCNELSIKSDSIDFVENLKKMLYNEIDNLDKNFNNNEFLSIKNGEPSLKKLEKREYPKDFKKYEELIKSRIKPVNLLDIMSDTNSWLNWTEHFGNFTGYDTKVDDPKNRYLSTVFCYGCNLGPTQTSRALSSVSKQQLLWTNSRHITIEKLEKTNTSIINAYNKFLLPQFWGTGKTASADGSHIEMYEQNIMSEYHFRYLKKGGIYYTHLSDQYVALFTHFIPCGIWEAVYILEGLLKNKSDIQPDTIYSDTQGQNAPVFGLAYLLGIQLLPRIRNWKDYKLFKVEKNQILENVSEIFSDTINWSLIEKHFPDMMRVVLSIREGRISSTTILKRLGSHSRKNLLYRAFRELGRVIRTIYMMKYLNDINLRRNIQSATNKSEAFNGFLKWILFGEKGILKNNNREMQKKIIKYNQVIANCIIFYNVNTITNIIDDLISEGYDIPENVISHLSPFLTKHVNRFGKYKLNLDRRPPDVNYTKLSQFLNF